ncbi:hypothetical protein PIN31115_01049 [Pandoraea iniqua]|uniref:Uncharacterized protein n=1 Tax=Pandoraea iniqua TaxID=2508288 RepID=A0A5E4SUZ5_9BURK|nr:hypothetical protein PIN31115_01049 [Pandoraea iniqua]
MTAKMSDYRLSFEATDGVKHPSPNSHTIAQRIAPIPILSFLHG